MFWDNKKTLTVVAVIILGVIAWFTSIDHQSKIIDIDNKYFAIKDSTAISKIVLSQNGKEYVTVDNTSGNWKINDRFDASYSIMTKVLYIIKNVTAKREYSGQNAKSDIEKIKALGVELKIYDKSGKVLSHFIADNGDITTSSCFFDPKSQKAYFVELPGQTDVFSKFFHLDINFWRNKSITNNNLKDLVSVTSIFNKKKVTLEYKDAFFEIKGVEKIDSNTVGMYLLQFKSLQCDAFVDHDSISKYCPTDMSSSFGSVEIKDINPNKNNTIYLFEVNENAKMFLGYSTSLKECFWLEKGKGLDLLIETERLFEKRNEEK